LLFVQLSLTGFSQTDSVIYSPVQSKFTFDWGNNLTTLLLTQYGPRTEIVMIHLHDNESASAKAAKKVLERTGGLLIQVQNKEKRLMHFKKSGKSFLFDPNRIFTPAGIRQNLRFLNNHVTSAALSSVKAFSAFILQKIPNSATILIALHNNNNGKYSINSYRGNGSHKKDASMVYANKKNDPDNFFIVTDKQLFKKLKAEKYNVILQNNAKAKDDGSLSVYCGKIKIGYVNVEAEQGSMEEQVRMLRSLRAFVK